MKNIPFFAISKVIIKILSDRNYKKYAIKKPTTINQILKINDWAKNLAGRKLVKYNVS